MNIKTPKDWRKGQTIFNFLAWLRKQGFHPDDPGSRMADPFYISDDVIDAFYEEFLKDME